ncbi:response regulator [Candidatus Gracilibacteria bacterium]|jgi:two-component system, chemotaxis family, response regulator PixG|nr:response regulator [Candidatus Gracilibacteria bacterium]
MNLKKEILAIMLMRFKIQPLHAIPMLESWFAEHPQATWETLKNLLKEDKLTVFDGSLQELSQQPYKLLCIDDSPLILQEIERFLEKLNYSVFLIKNPIQATRELIRIVPDLILMDVNMPGIDGYKLCRLIRNHSVLKTKPVVMMTGNTGFLDRAKARMVGATDYLTKPFSCAEFLEVVQKYLG